MSECARALDGTRARVTAELAAREQALSQREAASAEAASRVQEELRRRKAQDGQVRFSLFLTCLRPALDSKVWTQPWLWSCRPMRCPMRYAGKVQQWGLQVLPQYILLVCSISLTTMHCHSSFVCMTTLLKAIAAEISE